MTEHIEHPIDHPDAEQWAKRASPDHMTLIERLRNPAWKSGGPWTDAVLDVERTRADMSEAADRIEQLEKALNAEQRRHPYPEDIVKS